MGAVRTVRLSALAGIEQEQQQNPVPLFVGVSPCSNKRTFETVKSVSECRHLLSPQVT